MTRDELLENFSFLEGWEERYGYVIDLGKKLPGFPPEQKIEQNIVRGCTSQVWMIGEDRRDGEQDGKVHFRADSDAHIVRGLIAILAIIYDGQDKEFVKSFSIQGFFGQLGLEEHLSPNRRSGFYAMVERIKSMAA